MINKNVVLLTKTLFGSQGSGRSHPFYGFIEPELLLELGRLSARSHVFNMRLI
jgi:hypothetical protein